MPSFVLGPALNYAILFEAAGGSNLHIGNGTTNTVGSGPSQGNGIGNIGVGASGSVQVSTGTLNGNVDFANTSNYSGVPPTAGHSINSNVTAVSAALSTVNALNSTLGGLSGANVAINGNTTINASAGTFSASGPGYANVRVFNVTSFSLGNGQTLTINGDANGDSVVLNFTSNTNFNGGVVLNGLTPDNVIFNFVGGSNLSGGLALGFNSGKSDVAQGIFLDPNGSVDSQESNIFGRLFGGDTDDIQFNGGSNITAPLATPTLTTAPNPSAVTLGTTTVTLQDSATLLGSNAATGSIIFSLFFNGGSTAVHTETVAVNGDGTYTTTTGYTLPSTGQVTGTYQWVATYSGNSRNHRVKDIDPVTEQVTVSAANPTLNTSQQPATAIVGTSIADKATVTGYHPTGTVTFNLYDNPNGTGSPLFTDAKVPLVNGMATSTGYTATATGTDYWVATYNGDSNNGAVTSGTALEPVKVTPASPSINTQQLPSTATVGSSIGDKATVSGGFNPTGTVTFNLYNNPNGTGTPLFTDANVPLVNGIATSAGYAATATGTDYWVATYNGDSNNTPVTSGTAVEPVTVTQASPSINTQQQPPSVTVGSSIADTATVSGGFNPTGTVTFNLYNNPSGAGTPLFTDANVPLSGGVATSSGFTTTATGTDYWVATYNGDDNNRPVSSSAAAEPVIINPATQTITTSQQPASAIVGTTIADQATVTGLFGAATGATVTFNLYSSPTVQNPTTLLFTNTQPLSINGSTGTATSAAYTTAATGTVYWVAMFGPIPKNNAARTGMADEPVVIRPATPTITTTQMPASAIVGTAIADQATVSGGFNPTGTVTFNLYNNPNGTGTPLFTDTQSLVNGMATSADYTATATGTDYWVATYNGDSNNVTVTTGTADEPVVISPAGPTLAISTHPRPATAAVGTAIVDHATITGGFNPTGTVTFNLYDNPNGTGTPLFTDADVPLSGGIATSARHTVTSTGTVYWVASYSGDSNNNPIISGTALEPVVIHKATPAIRTSQQPASITVGAPIADRATVTGGFNLTGTVTFNLYDNPDGTGTPLFTDANVPLVNGMAMSSRYTTTATGPNYWVVSYNGDANNNPVTSGTAGEKVVIAPATPAITTSQQPARATVGTSIADQATVTGGFHPTGTVTLNLYNNPNGTGTPLFTDALVPLVNGTATSAGYITIATGTDYWVASYNGDSNNNPVASGTAVEPVVISEATPAITTKQMPPAAIVGAAIADQATVTGGFDPTGTVTFNLYNNPSGTRTPLFTDTEPLSGGSATSKAYTATAIGTDYWVATYNGDSNNNPVASGTAREPVVISKAAPAISTDQQPATATAGSLIADIATLTGGFNPTGTVTFKLYNNPSGSGRPLVTDTEPLSGAMATSKAHIATATGTYYWVATYNGDSNNTPVTSGTALEPVVITPASPSINTQQQPSSAAIGSAIADQATVTGGFNPSETVTFNLYDNPNGTGTRLFTDTEPLSGGSATSKGYTATAIGTDYWVATYNGDSNNNTITSGTSLEPVTIGPATPAIATSPQPPNAHLGDTIADKATVTGGFNPTGTVTFNLYHNPTAFGTPLFSDTEPLSGGSATSSVYTTTATGTFFWVATYNGDANNQSVSSGPLDEPVVIAKQADVVLTETPSTSQVFFGMNVTYTLVVGNAGPDTATNVVVADPLPPGLVFVSAVVPSQGGYDPATGIWTVGTLANGASATLQVTARVMAVGPIVNTADASALEFDPVLANNFASATVIGLAFTTKRGFLAN